MIVLGPKLYFKARQDINLWVSSTPFNAFASTSSCIRRCVGLKSSCTKRITIARASPVLAVPSKITLAYFTVSSSLRSLYFSFSNTAGMIYLRLVLLVNLWPYFSNRGRRTSTFDRGIPPVRTHSTISNRNKRMSAGNVDPLGCSRMSRLLRHSIIDWLCFLSLAMRATPFVCLLDFICFDTLSSPG